MENLNIKAISIGAILLLAGVVGIPSIVETLDASEVMVIQSISGTLTVHTDPGPKWQGFGSITKYPRQGQYSFCSTTEENSEVPCENADSTAKKLRFNDGGHANLNGFVMWEMPIDEKSIIEIHKRFGSAEAVQKRAVAKMIDGAVYLAGPLMSSTESSGSRRAELVQVINDQAENGVYVTHAETVLVKDPITGAERSDPITRIVMDSNGLPKRQQGSVLAELGIKLQPMSISELKYDSVVESQIKQRQEATTQVQIAQANAKRAEQDAITTAKQGEANAAKAKWEQETIKAQKVTEAEQERDVAKLMQEKAEYYKQEQILIGQGDAERKRLVMAANGALDQKLEAYKAVQGYWANAFAQYKGSLVPQTVMGGAGNQTAVGNVHNLVDLLTAKTAKDIAAEVQVTK